MNRLFPFVGCALFAIVAIFVAGAVHADTIAYASSSSPIKLTLSVNSERAVFVEQADSISVGIPPELTFKLDLQVIGSQLWLTARDEFEATRIIVLARPSGRLVFEVSAVAHRTDTHPITVRLPSSSNSAESSSFEPPRYGFAKLTRWAAQQLYAPSRLLKPLPGVAPVPVKSAPVNIFRCGNRVPTLCAGAVNAVPIIGWRSSDHFVTAVKIKNNLDRIIILDPREIIGSWRTASFMHSKLGPRGVAEDGTIVILISDFPFDESFGTRLR